MSAFEASLVNHKPMIIRMVVGSVVFVFVSVYAPQANLSESVKDQFYYALQSTIARVSSSEQLIISGDWNGHIGSHSTAFEDVHGGQALGKRNNEGERLLKNLLLPMNWLLVTPGSRRNLNIWLHTSQEIVKPKLTTYCIREV